jgi:hypothetical protein
MSVGRGLVDGEAVLELPLLGGAFAGFEEGGAGWGGSAGRGDGRGAGGIAAGEVVGRGPEAFALEEGVLERGAGHGF